MRVPILILVSFAALTLAAFVPAPCFAVRNATGERLILRVLDHEVTWRDRDRGNLFALWPDLYGVHRNQSTAPLIAHVIWPTGECRQYGL